MFPDAYERRAELERLLAARSATVDRTDAIRARMDASDYDPTAEDERALRAALDEAERYTRDITAIETELRAEARNFTPAGTAYGPVENGTILRSDQSFAAHVNAAPAERRLSFGGMLRGYVTGNWDGYEAERRAMSTTGASALVPTAQAAWFIDAARNATRVLQAGARTVKMDAKVVSVPRLTGVSAPAWRSEGGAIASGDLTVDAVTLTAQSLAFMVTMNRELLLDSDPSALNLIMYDLAAQVALELDRVALRGTGSAPEPEGVLNATGIGTDEAGSGNGDTLANLGFDFLLDMQAAIRAENFEPNAYLAAPRTFAGLAKLKDSSSGQYLVPPRALDAMRDYSTAQVPIGLTVGSNTDCSEVYMGQWNQLLLGVREEPITLTINDLHAATGQADLIIHMRGDIAVAQPAAFYVETGVRG